MMLFSVYIVAGHFLFMNSSSQKPGDVVRIKTPFFPASHGVCYMRFWYYMFGATNIGPLKVWRERERERERERGRDSFYIEKTLWLHVIFYYNHNNEILKMS